MQQRGFFPKNQWGVFLAIILLLITISSLVFLLIIRLGSFSGEKILWPQLALVGAGMMVIDLACIVVFLRAFRQSGRVARILSEKNRELEAEREVRRGAEEKLQQALSGFAHRAEEQILLSTVIEQTEDNVLITDCHRTILYINPAFERSCGYTCAELKGKPLRHLRSDQHNPAFYRTMKDTLDRGEVWMGIIVNRGKDGLDFEIEGTISPIRDEAGAISHWVAVGRNMSRFRKLERELHRAQKMDALGTLAGGIAHDFNNILAAVMGMIELECLDAKAQNRGQDRLEKALTACGRARDLVRQILAFSSQGEQRRKILRLGPVVEDALQMMRATLPATITIQTELAAAQALILGDATQIHQIIINLCTNAAHAMRRSGGTLRIALKTVEIDRFQAFERPDLEPGSYVCLSVSDTGCGIDRGTRERIFEPFFTTKAPGEGAGVGLSVVHGIVKSHGGRITVQSDPGKGSTFTVFFPGIEGEEEQPARMEEPSPAGSERILLVDDEDMVVAVTSEMLISLGYQVVPIRQSDLALELFRKQADSFHLVITDQTMPKMTGMELAAELLRIRKDIPIILSTGHCNDLVKDTALTIGIRKVISKPFALEELAASVRDVLD